MSAALAAVALAWELHGMRYVPGQAAHASDARQRVFVHQKVWLADDGRYRWETDSVWPGAIRFRYLAVGNQDGQAVVDTLGWRNGIEIERAPAASARQTQSDLLLLLPAVLQARVQQAPTWTDPAGRQLAITWSAAGDRITAVQQGTTSYHYQYQGATHAGVQVMQGGQLIASWQVSPASEPADFNLPPGYVEKQARGPLRLERLGPGLFRSEGAPSGYHAHVVAGPARTVVFDPGPDPEEVRRLVELLQGMPELKPVSDIVLSHSHRDHAMGALAWKAAPGVRVWHAGAGQPGLQRLFGAAFGDRLTAIGSGVELDLGDRMLSLRPVRTEHADDMLLAYDHANQAALQGDLFYLPEVGPAPVQFAGAQDLARALAGAAWPARWLLGVHGRAGSAADWPGLRPPAP